MDDEECTEAIVIRLSVEAHLRHPSVRRGWNSVEERIKKTEEGDSLVSLVLLFPSHFLFGLLFKPKI